MLRVVLNYYYFTSAEHATRNNMVYDKCPVPPDIDTTNDEGSKYLIL